MSGCICVTGMVYRDNKWQEQTLQDVNCPIHGKDAQPLPEMNNLPIAHVEVMKDLQERLALGMARYGAPLQPFNGRKSIQDAYEEALDMCVYLWCVKYELEHPNAGQAPG